MSIISLKCSLRLSYDDAIASYILNLRWQTAIRFPQRSDGTKIAILPLRSFPVTRGDESATMKNAIHISS
jgi:hypothetical protein